jgi:hypothetical protein
MPKLSNMYEQYPTRWQCMFNQHLTFHAKFKVQYISEPSIQYVISIISTTFIHNLIPILQHQILHISSHHKTRNHAHLNLIPTAHALEILG